MILRVCIVEDEQESVDRLKFMLQEFCSKEGYVCSIKVFGDGMNFISDYIPEYDIIFMDIEMPYLDGMKAAARLRRTDPEVSLIFVTNLAQYALKGYEVAAIGYLLKPLEYFSFAAQMKRTLSKIPSEGQNLLIKTSSGMIRMDVSRLKYVEVINHFLIYHTLDGDFRAYGQLAKIEKALPSPQFFKINKSYVINFHYIDKFNKDSVAIGDDEIFISRSKIKPCREAFNLYLEGTLNG